MDWRDYITVDPNVCHGQACIAGTRVMVTVILDNLAAGLTARGITESYPQARVESALGAAARAGWLGQDRSPAVTLDGTVL